MQKMLYPYLPEGMRNPQTFEWMMSNPEYRSQLEQMLEKQVCFIRLQHHHWLPTNLVLLWCFDITTSANWHGRQAAVNP